MRTLFAEGTNDGKPMRLGDFPLGNVNSNVEYPHASRKIGKLFDG